MAESNATQVILTDDGIKIIKAQNTADNAASGITNLNDPNLMSVIEKQNNIGQFAGLTSQYNVLVQNAKDDGIDTTAVTTAYNNLNQFMADILADPDHASDIDRATYKKYQDAYNEELAKIQNALQNNTNNKFTSAASALNQAASTANVAKSAADSAYTYANSEIAVQSTATAKAQSAADGAFSQAQVVGSQADSAIAVQSTATAKAQSAADNAFNKAQEVGNQASSEISAQSEVTAKAQSTADNAFSQAQAIGSQANSAIAVQSNATAKAQSTADSAFSQAVTAIDTGKATSQAVTALKDGSTLTIAQLGNGLASKVSNSEYASYKEQTASQIGQMVTNGSFSAYQQTTADLISSKVATKDFTAYQATTAKSIDSKVESSDFNTYKTQTANLISEKVSNSEYASNKEQTASQIADRVSNSAFSTYKEQTASQIASKVDGGDFSTYKTQTADLISSKVATKDFSAYQDTTAKAISSKVESNDFNTYKTQTANLINDKVSSAKYTSDKTQTDKDIASKVSSDDFSTYKTQTNELIGSKVSNGDFSTYKEQTARLISSKVDNGDFTTYKTQTAKDISSKVSSGDFNTYKTQTDKAILSKVSTTDFNNLTIGSRNLVLNSNDLSRFRVWTQGGYTKLSEDKKEITIVSSHGGINVNRQSMSDELPANGDTVVISADIKGNSHIQFNYNDGSGFGDGTSIPATSEYKRYSTTFKWQPVDVGNIDFVIFTTGNPDQFLTIKNVKIEVGNKATDWSPAPEDLATQSQFTQLSGEIEQKVDSGTFSSYKTETANLIGSKVDNGDFSTYKTQTADLIAERVATKDFTAYQDTTAKAISSKVESSDFNTYKEQTAGMISSKVSNGDFSTYKTQTASDINLRVTKDGLISQINIKARNTLISSGGQLTLSGKSVFLDSVDPVIMKSANIDTLLVGKKLTAADISADKFTTNNGTFTVEQDGSVTAKNMTLNGGKLYSPTINASTINGSTINATTFNGGDRINNANNTSNFHPFTIEPNGKVSTTLFNPMDALRTEMGGGGLRTMYRSINSSDGKYEAYDGVFDGNMISLNSGFTNGKDMSFSQSVSGNRLEGQVTLSPLDGIHLWGSTQSIHFSGLQMNGTGITFNSYGNIIADPASNWWRIVDFSGNGIANFGTDTAGSNAIQFNRELDIGNFHINTGHTFTSADGGAIHFAKGRGGANDIYAGDVHYNSLVKSSLLSVKKDVKKVDTAYWAQLVNSIDLATYQYKSDDNTSHLRLSSIVDDVNDSKQWQLPDVFISRDEDGKLCGVDDSVLLNATLATVQEQQKEIDQLNGHNMELEARLNKLEAKLNG